MPDDPSGRPLRQLADMVVRYNGWLTNEINNLVESNNLAHQDQQIKQIMAKLCHNMVRFNDYHLIFNAAEGLKFDIWSNFLTTTKTLMKLPHPQRDFITARMLLYLGFQFHQAHDEKLYRTAKEAEETALSNFCIELDDALLEPLRNTWKSSNNYEDFKWVFVDDRIHLAHDEIVMNESDLKIAQALSPSERTQISKQDGTKFHYYKEAFDINKANPTLFEGLMPRWDCGEENTDGFFWTTRSSDGPIRLEITYEIETFGRENNEKTISMFRRSRQFCLDARQISEGKTRKQAHIILDEIAIHYKLPREIQGHILEYLPYREPFPYLQKLDLAAAYTPFPIASGHYCADCKMLPGRPSSRRTCPGRSMWIWNLPLRRFNVFHTDQYLCWALCAHGAECAGHHDGHDREWIVERGPNLSLFIEKEISKLNDEFISLDQVGLGPVRKIRLDTKEEDTARQQRLASCNGIYRDSGDDWKMTGGLSGLVDSMLHGRVLIGAWAHNGTDEGGTDQEPAQWALGRSLKDQESAQEATRDLHAWPGRCEWC
ncbi:hypothetical protein FVEN_g1398 [Fusarium venenatum]|uniref:Uncharacterized protein n=1 Tax=Fusarium venenatum TaxID=56646 RepID=A0A2L2TGM7_9HYPO|nr:uncharacterized protein FVRRES_13403 [Fusarium venenatum]KAG8361017.1 hypothetical protein FVEN_g1398 [Fusarium venenatum]KAH6979944.1 hypothetical protein EDB82DRAFT_509702 [Fusarium venenatum]CEI41062.1 unnamed protein product [Fusarium venenatum]